MSNNKQIVTLPGYEKVLVDRKSGTKGGWHNVEIRQIVDGEPLYTLARAEKDWIGVNGVPMWEKAVISTSLPSLEANEVDAYIALLTLAKAQAEALDNEFVPGTEVVNG